MDEEIKELDSIIKMFDGKKLNAGQKKILLSLTKVKKAIIRRENYITEIQNEVARNCKENISAIIEVKDLRSKLLKIKLNA